MSKAVKIVLLVILAEVLIPCFAQNNKVYYYERTKKSVKGQVTAAAGDGHYLAFNQNGLYECNASGSSYGRGFVKYINSDNGHPYYSGNAYLGNDISFVFNSDYSKLNIYVGSETIYVYERRSGPSSAQALRSYESSPGNFVPIETTPTYPDRTTPTPHHRRPCSLCKGTGREIKYQYVGGEAGSKKKWCSECGTYVRQGHYHVRCSLCHGKGYLED